MKKTLVAVAALAAVTGAMAEVTISGFVDKAYNSVSNTTAAGAKSSATNVGPNAIGQDQITFAVTEDLGNGISAYAKISVAPDISNRTLGGDNGQVGLKGDFGNIRLGSDYGTNWYAMNAADASGWGAGAGNVHNVGAGAGTTDVVIYSLPALPFAQGLGITIAHRASGDQTGVGSATAYSVSYSTGGFTGIYAHTNIRTDLWTTSSGIGATTYDNAYGGTAGQVGTATREQNAGLATAKADAWTLTYDFGMAKVFFGQASAKSGFDTDQKASSYTYGVSVPFAGAFTARLAFSNATYSDATGTAAGTVKENGYRFLLQYAMSKRTNLYYQNGRADVSGNSASTSSNGLGITHNF